MLACFLCAYFSLLRFLINRSLLFCASCCFGFGNNPDLYVVCLFVLFFAFELVFLCRLSGWLCYCPFPFNPFSMVISFAISFVFECVVFLFTVSIFSVFCCDSFSFCSFIFNCILFILSQTASMSFLLEFSSDNFILINYSLSWSNEEDMSIDKSIISKSKFICFSNAFCFLFPV